LGDNQMDHQSRLRCHSLDRSSYLPIMASAVACRCAADLCLTTLRRRVGRANQSRLHWLRILQRIQFKVAVLTSKVLHDFAPSYFSPFVCVADFQVAELSADALLEVCCLLLLIATVMLLAMTRVCRVSVQQATRSDFVSSSDGLRSLLARRSYWRAVCPAI